MKKKYSLAERIENATQRITDAIDRSIEKSNERQERREKKLNDFTERMNNKLTEWSQNSIAKSNARSDRSIAKMNARFYAARIRKDKRSKEKIERRAEKSKKKNQRLDAISNLKIQRIKQRGETKIRRRQRAFERASALRDMMFERRMAGYDRRHQRRMKKYSRNQEKYARRAAKISRKYLREKKSNLFTVLSVLLAVSGVVVEWITFAAFESNNILGKLDWLQTFIAGFVSVSPIIILIGVLVIAALVNIINLGIVRGIVAKFSTVIFSLFLVNFAKIYPDIMNKDAAFDAEYISILLPAFLLVLACFFMSYSSIRALLTTVADRIQAGNISKFSHSVQKLKTGTPEIKTKFLSMFLTDISGFEINAKTISVILASSIVATSIWVVILRQAQEASIFGTCLVLFALPAILEAAEIIARPESSARKNLATIGKEVFDFAAKNLF